MFIQFVHELVQQSVQHVHSIEDTFFVNDIIYLHSGFEFLILYN